MSLPGLTGESRDTLQATPTGQVVNATFLDSRIRGNDTCGPLCYGNGSWDPRNARVDVIPRLDRGIQRHLQATRKLSGFPHSRE
jgi:hypothetical protein